MTMLKSILILTVSVLSASSAAYAADKEAPALNPVSALTSQRMVNVPALVEEVKSTPTLILQSIAFENGSDPVKSSLSRMEKVKKFFSKMFICCKAVEDDILTYLPKIEQDIATVASEAKEITQDINSIVNNIKGLAQR